MKKASPNAWGSLLYINLISESGNAVAVDETVELHACLTQRTFARGMALVIGNIVFAVDAANGESLALICASEDRAYADGHTVIITDRLDRGLHGVARSDGSRNDHSLPYALS